MILSDILFIFLNLLRGSRLHNFAYKGLNFRIFRREALESGVEGDTSENFDDFSENLFLKNEIKELDILGGLSFRKEFSESLSQILFFCKYCFPKMQ